MNHPLNRFYFGIEHWDELVADRASDKHGSKYFIIEQDPRKIDKEKFDELGNDGPTVYVIGGHGYHGMFMSFYDIFKAPQDLQTILSCGLYGCDGDVEYAKRAIDAYKHAIRSHLAEMGNSVYDSWLGQHQMMENLENIAKYPGVKQLFGKMKGKPAVLVAAGPSLDKNIDELDGLEDNAVIFCADAVLGKLLKRGIKPHFACLLERVAVSPKLFDDIGVDEAKNTTLVTVPVAKDGVYDSYPGQHALLFRPYSHFNWLDNDKGTLSTGHSCMNMAFKLAVEFGCNPIILVGQDLAYGEDGCTHSEVTPWGKEINGWENVDFIHGERYSVKGNTKESVITNSNWDNFRLGFSRDIDQCNVRVLNCTEGGAYIEGTEVLTLKKVKNTVLNSKVYAKDTIDKWLKKPSEEECEAFIAKMNKEKIQEARKVISALRAKITKILEDDG